MKPMRAFLGDLASGVAGKFLGASTQFVRREDGSIVPFTLTILLLMLTMGGVTVDIMKSERIHTNLSQTLDRAVLASASLSQTLKPADVVADYFAKAGMSQYLSSVTVSEGLNFRDVSATARADTNPYFMHLVGIDEMTAGAKSQAVQRINNIEVSMVLDISGSMQGSRINNLRPAAREFIDTVIGSSEAGRVTMNIIPYSGHVNLGPALSSQFNAPPNHTVSYCIDLPASTYGSISVSRTIAYPQAANFDPYYTYNYGTGLQLQFCPTSPVDSLTKRPRNEVTAMSDNATFLKNRITALDPEGNTSIDIGMKWGSLLLDPGAQPVITGMIAAGAVLPAYAGRPLNRSTADVLKIIVLMTDGENTTEYRMRPDYMSGASNVWKSANNGALSLYHGPRSGTTKYYWLSDSKWHTLPDGGKLTNGNITGASAIPYVTLWKDYTVSWVAMKIYSRALHGSTTSGHNTWFNTFVEQVYSEKNTRLNTVCTAAKNAGITVFGIGFEAPSNGRTAVQNCATSPAHYFDASGIEISTVFRSIASQISQLRLTQ